MNGTVNTPYSGVIGVSGGTAPYSCMITAGTLPTGLTLGASCTVSGTPTAAGTANLTVKATDAANPAKNHHWSGLADHQSGCAHADDVHLAQRHGRCGLQRHRRRKRWHAHPTPAARRAEPCPPGSPCLQPAWSAAPPPLPGPPPRPSKATDSSNPVAMTSGPETITVAPAPLSLTLAKPAQRKP